MQILGIDYGRKKIGLAFGNTEARLAEPLRILRDEDIKILSQKIGEIVKEYNIEKIVVGISEGEMAKETKEFGKKLEENLKVPVIFQDETLTTQDAQKFAIEAGINRKKRKLLEDAYSAAIILQTYLDYQK